MHAVSQEVTSERQELELAILQNLATLWKIDMSKLPAYNNDKYGCEIEDKTEYYYFKNSVTYITIMKLHGPDKEYLILHNEQAYIVMKNKYRWAQHYMSALNGDIKDEPDESGD